MMAPRLPTLDREDVGAVLFLGGAFLTLVGAWLIWPPLSISLIGLALLFAGRRTVR